MTVFESLIDAPCPLLDDNEIEHREEMRQQAIACMYGWA